MAGDPSIAVDPTVAPTEPRSGELTDLEGSTLVGRYEVGPLLGEGAMGSVFRGHHRGLSRDVAIKVLRPEFTQHRQIAARFEREAKVVSMLSHPGIVRVFDFGPEPMSALGRPIVFIVMELLAGQELKALLGNPLDPDLALRRTEQMLEGIAHAHERGVIHRDLKPENVFVTTDPSGAEQLKLVDFGIAKLLEGGGPALTQMGMVFGTPAYMSPEQAIGGATDERADLYAVGVILYEMLGGQPPFIDDDIGVMLRRQISEEPKRIGGLHPAVQSLLDRLLAKSAGDRIASAADAIAAVRAVRAELAKPPPAPVRSGTQLSMPAVHDAHAPPGLGGADASASVPRATSIPPVGVATRSMSMTGMHAMAPARQKWLTRVGAGAAVVALVGVIWAAGGDDDEPSSTAPGVVDVAGPGQKIQDALRDRAPDETLAAIDTLLADGKWSAAGTKLDELIAEHPEDGRLLWRRARQLRGKGSGPAARGKVFAEALRVQPSLLEDEALRQELNKELGASRVADELVETLAERSDAPEVLLPLALRTKNALPYRARHLVLEAIGRDPVQAAKIDRAMHRCLDVWQAGGAEDPCRAYGDALDAMTAKPDVAHLGTLLWAPAPQGCADAAADQAQVLAVHQEQFPGAAATLPPDFESKRPKKKKKRRGFFGIFR
jgi:serine/threonine protein kinase